MVNLISLLPRGVRGLLPERWRKDVPVVPVVRLSGTIGVGSPLFSPALTLAGCARTLEKAFAVKEAPAVALLINSPGGAPTQSHLIFQRIRALAGEKNKHVFAFVEDVAASGGYMIACAADEIFADPCSVVGSIGVVSAGFGFDKAIARLGIERRVYTAGDRKVTLDPFRPERPEDVQRLDGLLKELHAVFADLVRTRRGKALTADEASLFSGEFWLAGRARELGLIDGIGDVRAVLRSRYGEAVETPLIQPPSSWLRRRFGGVASGVGAGLAHEATTGVLAAAETRALWDRYGL